MRKKKKVGINKVRDDKPLHLVLAAKSGHSVEEVQEFLERLKLDAVDEARTSWNLAHRAVEGKTTFKMTNEQIAKWIRRSAPRVGEFVNTMSVYGNSPLKDTASFDQANTARKVWNNYDKTAKANTTPEAVLENIIKSGDTARQTRKKLNTQIREKRQKEAADEAGAILDAAMWLNEVCFQANCLEFLDRLPDMSLSLVHFDPPYFGMARLGIGTYSTAHDDISGIECDADSLDRDDAVKLYCEFFRRIAPKLKKNGCVAAYLSATTSSDLPGLKDVLTAIDEGGLRIAHEVHWLKDRIPPKNFERPFSTQTETIWILCRKDEHVFDCFDHDAPKPPYLEDGFSLRSNVIRFKTVTGKYIADKRAGRPTEKIVHSFEKPCELAMYLTEKLSLPGELVWDACGCHGNLTLGAIRVGRKVIYTESNADRFAEGVRRVHRELAADQDNKPNSEIEAKPLSQAIDQSDDLNGLAKAA